MLNMISRDLRIDLGLDVFVFDWWFTPFWNEGLQGLQQSGKYGVFHACELETSLMLGGKAGNRTYGTGCGRGACGLL